MSSKGDILLLGDFNARVNNLSEFISNDNYGDVNLVFDHEDSTITQDRELTCRKHYFDSFSHETARVTQDTIKPNKRGKNLIKFCKSCDLRILNGRKIRDTKDKITCFRWNGCSVVDYAICSATFYDDVKFFEVKEHMPWLSDHSPIAVNLSHVYEDKTCRQNNALDHLPRNFKWNTKLEEAFENYIRSDCFTNEVTKIHTSFDNLSAFKFKVLLYAAVKDSGGEKVKPKNRNKSGVLNKPWFDKDCSSSKRNLSDITKKRIAQPLDTNTRVKANKAAKEFKTLMRRKKYKYNNRIINDMISESHSNRKFWEALNKLKPTKVADNITTMAPHLIHNHFTNLLQSQETPKEFPKCGKIGPLDSIITNIEIDNALKAMNKNSSPGLDVITTKMLKIMHKVHPDFFSNFFSKILISGQYPREWSCALLIPIFKKRGREELNNYRGISILSATSKLFCTILNERLTTWAIKENKIASGQLGFMKGNRTSDAHIIINNLVSYYCHKRLKKFYACFVDLEKAFDKLPRDLLLQKLRHIGVSGNFLNILNTMYTNDYVKVRVGNRMTKAISVNQGLRQGCVLSPILFNLFLADLQQKLVEEPNTSPVSIDNNTSIPCILWADDIVLLSETREGLQSQINFLHSYCNKNKLSVNVKKTACICFNKSGALINNAFLYNNLLIPDKKCIKYLGFCITANGGIKEGLEDLKNRAGNAYYKLKTCLNSGFRQNVPLTLKLFDSLVKPILLYASDFWGMHKQNSMNLNPCEKIHMDFCKQVLGVSETTSNFGVLIELGRDPIFLQGKKLSLNNWLRICGQNKCNEILKLNCLHAMKENLLWAQEIVSNIKEAGLEIIMKKTSQYKAKGKVTKLFYDFKRKMFLLDARNSMGKLNSKVNILNLTKSNDHKISEYLYSVTNIKHRIAMSKLRLASHSLRIETGRYAGLAQEDRVCPFHECSEIEHEEHFLVRCREFQELRNKLFTRISIIVPEFKNLNDRRKFLFLFKCETKVARLISKFVYQAFLLRENTKSELLSC